MKKLSLALCLLVSGFAGSAFAQFEPMPPTPASMSLPNLMCQEQFGKVGDISTYLVILGNVGIVIDAPSNDPFGDVCVYFPTSKECKDRQRQPQKPSKAAVRLYLNVDAVTSNGRGSSATGTVSTRGADAVANRFKLDLEYASSGWITKLAIGTNVRFFNCQSNGGLVLQ